MLLENTVLFDEIIDDRLLVAVKPASAIMRRWKGCITGVIVRTDYP